jgi:hypothetical protein
VTATAAALLARGESRAEVEVLRAALRGHVRDLGPAGRDTTFGWGMLTVEGGC